MFRTDWTLCLKFGERRHWLVCRLRCRHSKGCRWLREHEDRQASLIQREREEKVLPAYQHQFQDWPFQEWPWDRKEEKKLKPKEEQEEQASTEAKKE